MRLDDRQLVRNEYATDTGLAGRIAGYRFAEGPDAREVAFDAIAESRPRRVLEVGCGQGWLSERVQREIGCDVVAVDQSAHMVDLTRARGVRAQVADVEELPFDHAAVDCAVAAWMLYHVADVDRALSELARVLRPAGRLVAVTNSHDHLRELSELLGVQRAHYSFSAENAEMQLRRHFADVDRREAFGWIVFPGFAEAQEHVDHTIMWGGRRLPDFDGPLRVRRAPVIFVAEKRG